MKPNRLQLVFAHIDEPIPSTFLGYTAPTPQQSNNLSLRQRRKWKSRRLAHYLLHRLCIENQLDPRLLEDIHKTDSGRPYLCHDHIDFNISHSGEWVAVIFAYSSPKRAVGIDIEHPEKKRPYEKLLDYYAKASEIREIQHFHHLPQLDTLAARFYLSWCLREAVLKSQGVGIVKLSEVQHSLSTQRIASAYCPQGTLFFYHTLPFYLACFIEQEKNQCHNPEIFQWTSDNFQPRKNLQHITYQVN